MCEGFLSLSVFRCEAGTQRIHLSRAFRAGFNSAAANGCALRSALSCLRNYVRVTMPAVQKALYSRFAEIGRVVLISYGPEVRRDPARVAATTRSLSLSLACCLLASRRHCG